MALGVSRVLTNLLAADEKRHIGLFAAAYMQLITLHVPSPV